MGRLVIADDRIKRTIEAIAGSNSETTIGLIVGQSTAQKDVLCHLAPIPQDVNESEENAKKKSEGPKKWEDVDESWIVLHAKQVPPIHFSLVVPLEKLILNVVQELVDGCFLSVTPWTNETYIRPRSLLVVRMLPGGLNVLGLFSLGPVEVLSQKSFTKLKQILYAVFKVINHHPFQITNETVMDKIILHVCSTNNKITVKSVDISNAHHSTKPAEFKYKPYGIDWHRLDCRVALDITIPFNKEESTYSLVKQIYQGIYPFFVALKESVIFIDGEVRNDTDLLDGQKEVKGKKSKSRSSHLFKNHDVDVFMEQLFPFSNTNQCVIEDCGVMMEIKGTLQSRSFVYSRSTLQEAAEAVRQDIIRSLIGRCEIHCEDLLLIDEEQQDPNVVHEPPRRVFAHLPDSEITVSDYIFPGELARDSLNAYEELLSLKLLENDVEFECERLADSGDLSKVPSEKRCLGDSTQELLAISQVSKPSNTILVVMLSLAIAILAISISYLMYFSDGTNDFRKQPSHQEE